MNKRGRPAVLSGDFSAFGTKHNVLAKVDLRSNTKEPMIFGKYINNNYPFAMSVPTLTLDSTMRINAELNVDDAGDFSVLGKLNLRNVKLKAEQFEPAFAYKLYSSALSSIKSMDASVLLNWKNDGGLSLEIKTDADRQFENILRSSVNNALSDIKLDAEKQIRSLLNEKTGGATQKISEFIDLENGINSESVKLDKLNKVLEQKKNELKSMLEEKAKAAAKDSIEKTLENSSELKNAASALKKLF